MKGTGEQAGLPPEPLCKEFLESESFIQYMCKLALHQKTVWQSDKEKKGKKTKLPGLGSEGNKIKDPRIYLAWMPSAESSFSGRKAMSS